MLKSVSTSSRIAFTILIIALLTALASEIKIIPFHMDFRFGFGSIIFFLAILIKPVPIIRTGFATAITIVLFRTLIDLFFSDDHFWHVLLTHLPAALFYITFAVCLSFIQFERIRLRPMKLGLYGAFFEIVANCVEGIVLYTFFKEQLTLNELILIFAVAFLRSFFVVGIYSSISFSEQKKQMQQLLNIGSELYVETLYLKKSMQQIEHITAASFDLYKQLNPIDRALSLQALTISQEIHEVKKDSERIYAGLSKITTMEHNHTFLLSELLLYITAANEKYSAYLQKNITFKTTFNMNFKIHDYFTILALINNIVANAVEAIEREGIIEIRVFHTQESTIITIEDNGIGIKDHELPIIFDAGYTSKFNDQGKASTGIGLSHVQAIISHLEGSITVTNGATTRFSITIPTHRLL
ncbi:sensor histidine kinase [Solibacillus sp. CAU 1738]|uniref:ATP-binding protein n=1 Tax=Solibacillus sp. CAU 1738 TaxID=3140363 RepID=UPI0032615397